MAGTLTLGIVSDIHYAGPRERARGHGYEFRDIPGRWRRTALRLYRDHVWMRRPLDLHYLLDDFLRRCPASDLVVANGDFSCDSSFVGVSDDPACESARECLDRLRATFGAEKVRGTIGDHELGKLSFGGGFGGMRIESFHRARSELGLEPFWRMERGRYVFLGVASSLIALSLYDSDILATEKAEWQSLRDTHLAEIRAAFDDLSPGQRVLLFCHDPTALAFLWREPAIRAKLPWVERTIIGHLHTSLVFWESRLLAGMPVIPFGHSVRRMTRALNEARCWRHFRVLLCPSLSGAELLKDGGFYTAELDLEARRPACFHRHPLPRRRE